MEGGISSTIINVQHNLDDATAAILRQNAHHTHTHTPVYWWTGDSDEANQFMGMIRRP